LTEIRTSRVSAYLRLWGDYWRTFRANRLAVLGLVLLGIFLAMLIAHPILMATAWKDQRRIYDPMIGYDAPVIELTVVETIIDPATEIHLFEAQLKGDPFVKVGDVIAVNVQPAPPSKAHLLGTDPRPRRDLLRLDPGCHAGEARRVHEPAVRHAAPVPGAVGVDSPGCRDLR